MESEQANHDHVMEGSASSALQPLFSGRTNSEVKAVGDKKVIRETFLTLDRLLLSQNFNDKNPLN